MKRYCKKCLLAYVFICLSLHFMFADVKSHVFLVRPELDQTTQDLFQVLAQYYDRINLPNYANYFRYYTGERGGGTGWIYVDSFGDNYIITNRHVVSSASSANIYIEDQDGQRIVYERCPILYVDDNMDLAVLQFPNAERVFRQGFLLDTSRQRDLQRVISAGYPGFGSQGQQVWQLASGEVTNSMLRTDEPVYAGHDYLIQHSAPIDHGNSGGPLLREDASSPIGFTVVGVNTFKGFAGDRLRESTFLAIPAKEVEYVVQQARNAKALLQDSDKLREELIIAAKILAAELRSEQMQTDALFQYISYAFVGNRGWDSYVVMSDITQQANPDYYNYIQHHFYNGNAIEIMRYCIYDLFLYELRNRGNLQTIEFKEINFADDRNFANLKHVRTEFNLDGRSTEIVWTYEYGKWRVSDFQLLRNFTYAKPSSAKSLVSKSDSAFLVELGLGFAVGWEIGLEIETGFRYHFTQHLSTGAGLLLALGEDLDLYFGLNLALNYHFSDTFGLGIGFKGWPTYINAFGGPTINVFYENFYLRLGIEIFEFDGGLSLIGGYSLSF